MPIIATLEDLDESLLVKVLTAPKNSLIKQYQQIFKFEGVTLTFKEEALLEIAKKAIKKKTGARGLRSILEALLLKTMFNLPTQEYVEEVIIDQNVVIGKKEPVMVHSKNKDKTEKTSVA